MKCFDIIRLGILPVIACAAIKHPIRLVSSGCKAGAFYLKLKPHLCNVIAVSHQCKRLLGNR